MCLVGLVGLDPGSFGARVRVRARTLLVQYRSIAPMDKLTSALSICHLWVRQCASLGEGFYGVKLGHGLGLGLGQARVGCLRVKNHSIDARC